MIRLSIYNRDRYKERLEYLDWVNSLLQMKCNHVQPIIIYSEEKRRLLRHAD